jgi:hypothetical protein
MNDRRLEQRVAAVAEAALTERGFVTAIDVFLGLGWLAPSNEQAWRQGRTPCLERVVTANLSKITTAMRCFRAWARRRGLKPSETAYLARARGRRTLRFSKSGKPSIERAYRTHWVSPRLSEHKHERPAGRHGQPPEPAAVASIRREDTDYDVLSTAGVDRGKTGERVRDDGHNESYPANALRSAACASVAYAGARSSARFCP